MKPLTSCLPLAVLGVALLPPARGDDFRVPLMAQPPILDGQVEPPEWALAAGFDGFAFNGQLERRRIRAYAAATETDLFFAFLSQLPEQGELLAQVDVDSEKIVFDDSLEVWIDPTPGTEHGRTYQMLTNPIGRQGYKLHTRGNAPQDPAWRGRWEVANGFRDGYWHCEVRVPVADLAPARTADEGTWAINLCRNWKSPWAFSSLGGGPYAPEGIRFTFAREDCLAIRHETRADPFLGDLDMTLALRNCGAAPVAVNAGMLVKRDMMPELKESQALTIPPGEERQIALKTEDASTRKFDLSLLVTSPEGAKTYYSRAYSWPRGEAWAWTTETKEALPVDFQFAYYPYLNRMRVLADVSDLPGDAALDHLTCAVRPKGAAEPVKIVTFDRFVNGRQEMAFDLPPLDGSYEIVVQAHGENVPKGELVKPFERTVYEWERLGLGTTKKVYPPFTPIRVEGQRVSTVLREHTMNEVGLWDQVVAQGQPLLAAPMRLTGTVNGAPWGPRTRGASPRAVADDRVVYVAEVTAGPVRSKVQSTWDYDGTMRVDLELQPSGGQTVEELTLEIPLKASQATLYHAMGDGIRNTLYEAVPAGEGTIWTSERVATNDFPRGFCSYLYVGTALRGLSWFCENDRGWSWDRKRPNVDMVRRGETVTLRVHLINQPTVITRPRTITFGLLAAPVKPRLSPWRHRWNRDRYTLLGTDINWFALGDCGSVYPAHKDTYLWEMLKRGNQEKLSDEEVEEVVEYGRKYWEPYGPPAVESYERHVRYNLRSRNGMKMVFYYNRASFQLADEFQTFQDEWGLTDYRTVGPGNGIWEIKIVPTESYIDHALYWYGKSFDVGGNLGVYWDNWFFCGSYNTTLTAAYPREDGSIMPSNGLWGLRELSKRTFQYMNERGMTPITMPHMTSTNILPMHSFATVQYDWEWKYSEGDVQYRFPREYVLLVSNGDLAGTWPVLLGDHGKLAEDPWTQRTFAAVSILHELDGYGLPQVWDPLLKPIYALLDDPNLEVYRYWDERPQPVLSDNKDLPTIVYSVKGKEAVFAVVSYAEGDLETTLTIDPAALGFEGGYRVTNVETGEGLPVTGNKATLAVKKHDIQEFRVTPAGGGH